MTSVDADCADGCGTDARSRWPAAPPPNAKSRLAALSALSETGTAALTCTARARSVLVRWAETNPNSH
jgi:hypothetical protein